MRFLLVWEAVCDGHAGRRGYDMSPLSFEHWLARQRERQDPVGDLARDIAADADWPTGAHAEQRLNYLVGRDASPELIEAMAAANSEYEDLDATN